MLDSVPTILCGACNEVASLTTMWWPPLVRDWAATDLLTSIDMLAEARGKLFIPARPYPIPRWPFCLQHVENFRFHTWASAPVTLAHPEDGILPGVALTTVCPRCDARCEVSACKRTSWKVSPKFEPASTARAKCRNVHSFLLTSDSTSFHAWSARKTRRERISERALMMSNRNRRPPKTSLGSRFWQQDCEERLVSLEMSFNTPLQRGASQSWAWVAAAKHSGVTWRGCRKGGSAQGRHWAGSCRFDDEEETSEVELRAPSVKIDGIDGALPTSAKAVGIQEDLDHGAKCLLAGTVVCDCSPGAALTAGDASALTLTHQNLDQANGSRMWRCLGSAMCHWLSVQVVRWSWHQWSERDGSALAAESLRKHKSFIDVSSPQALEVIVESAGRGKNTQLRHPAIYHCVHAAVRGRNRLAHHGAKLLLAGTVALLWQLVMCLIWLSYARILVQARWLENLAEILRCATGYSFRS